MNFKRGLTAFGLALGLGVAAQGQTTTFNYQGELGSGGSLANGSFDFRFRLLDNNTNLIAGPATNAPVGVTNGLFTTSIDFGAAAFNGSPRALEIGVRNYGNTNAYTVLAPVQPVDSTPYAIQSLYASNALNVSGSVAATNLTGYLPDSLLSPNVAVLTNNVNFAGSVTAAGFSGGGAGLTGVLATNLAGILPDSLLSTNVARLNTNANFLTNVTAVQFTGSGHGLTNVPGAFFWLTVNGTATASPNLGFIVTNNVSPVTITLPANPSVGDTFRVAGSGAGGWTLLQNAGQSVQAGNLATTVGLNWTQQTNSGQHPWTGLASSADGTKLFATSSGYIYWSTNSGISWTAAGGSLYWSSIACSSDGTHLVATVGTSGGTSGYVYTSANSGVSWSQSTTLAAPWIACASSANGSVLAAVSYNGYIDTSADGGNTWTPVTSSISWTGVAISSDGTKLVACSTASGGGYLYRNSGAGWITLTNAGVHTWTAITSSADGTHLVATVSGTSGGIYNSANSGLSWADQNQNAVNWAAVTSSSDGSRLGAVYNSPNDTAPGYIYTSTDFGSSWIQRFGAGNAPWTAVASSGDGSKLAAAAYNGYIYTSGKTATTTGTTGYLTGGYQSALELQYVGNGVFLPLSHEGTILAY